MPVSISACDTGLRCWLSSVALTMLWLCWACMTVSVCIYVTQDYVYVYDGVPWYPVCIYVTQDYVYVYDGVPLFPGISSAGARLLAQFCGSNYDRDVSVVAHSGVMAVFFEAVQPTSSTTPYTRMSVCLIDAIHDPCRPNNRKIPRL